MELLCRICTARSDSLVDIFGDKLDLAEMINKCSTHPVKCGDALPQRICPVCLEAAGNAFRFREMCERSHEYLCKLLDQHKDMDEQYDMYIKEEHHTDTGVEQEEGEQEQEDYELYIKDEPDIEEENIIKHNVDNELQNFMEHDSDQSEESLHQSNEGSYEGANGSPPGQASKTEHRVKCPHCAKHIRRHLISYHINTHTGERPFKCSDCSRAFSDPNNLRRHSLIHQERSFECPHCPKKFTHSWILNVHIRIHTGERPFKCSYCSKTFTQSGTLDQHVRTHTGERPYQCSHCPKNFKKLSNLNAHMRTHTGARPYKCSICSKAYTHGSTLDRHMRTHRPKDVHGDDSLSEASSVVKLIN